VLRLLAERLQLCVRVGDLKERLGMPMMQPSRIAEVTERAAQSAAASGVSPQFAREIWQMIILEACRLERLRSRP
jgi:chorismate mutase